MKAMAMSLATKLHGVSQSINLKPSITCVHHPDLDLVLIGKSGSGKSATGNTILGCDSFNVNSSMEDVMSSVDFDYAEVQGRKLKVVDCPGFSNISSVNEKSKDEFMRVLKSAFAANIKGFHAFLIPMRFGMRITDEDLKIVHLLKKEFGEHFVKEYCIFVITFGDLFKLEHQQVNFTKWAHEQKGAFKELLTECSGRIILFDNRSNDALLKSNQVQELFGIINQMKCERFCYKFPSSDQQIVEMEKIFQELSLILKRFKACQSSIGDTIESLEKLIIRTEELITMLKSVYKNDKTMTDILRTAEQTKYAISEEIKLNVELKVDREEYQINKTYRKSKYLRDERLVNDKYLLLLADCPNDKEKQNIIKEELKKKVTELKFKYKEEKRLADVNLSNLIREKREKRMTRNREIVSYVKLEEQYRESRHEYVRSFLSRLLSAVFYPFQFVYNKVFNRK